MEERGLQARRKNRGHTHMQEKQHACMLHNTSSCCVAQHQLCRCIGYPVCILGWCVGRIQAHMQRTAERRPLRKKGARSVVDGSG